jgi:hypothetical protein
MNLLCQFISQMHLQQKTETNFYESYRLSYTHQEIVEETIKYILEKYMHTEKQIQVNLKT